MISNQFTKTLLDDLHNVEVQLDTAKVDVIDVMRSLREELLGFKQTSMFDENFIM